MKARGKGLEQKRFSQVRTTKTLIIGLLITSALVLSSFLVVTGGVSADPLYIPLDRALSILLIVVVSITILNMSFRALEVKYAPKQGQKVLLVGAAWRGAKRAFGIGLILALFFAFPVTQGLMSNFLSQPDSIRLDAGESFPLSFSNQDSMGITKVSGLRVSVQTGALEVRVSDGTRVVNPGGTRLGPGEQETIPLSASSLFTYTVTFDNLANGTTLFSYSVETGFPPGFTSLVFLLSAAVAGSNLLWLLYLRRLRTRMPKPRPSERPVAPRPLVQKGPAMPQRTPPRTSPQWWQLQRQYGLARRDVRRPAGQSAKSGATRDVGQESKGKLGMEREVPPPPHRLETYDMEFPAPPKAEDTSPGARATVHAPPPDISILLDKAEERISSGEYREALEDFDTVLTYDKRNLRALLRKAELLGRLQRFSEAIEYLDRALALDHWQHRAHLMKGQLLEEEGRHDEALECYETVVRGGPEIVEALLRKGDLMLKIKELELALEAYREALRLSPEEPEIEERIALLEEERKDPVDRALREAATANYDGAEELFLRGLQGERASEARRGLIDLYTETNRDEEALALLDEALESEPRDLDLILRRVKALTKRGRLADALEACEMASEVAPDESSVWAIRGALETDLGLGESAIESLERTLQLNPDDEESAQRLSELRHKGEERVELEAVVEGIEGVPKKAVSAILKKYSSLKELKAAKVRVLASLNGVSETAAKKVLRAVRKGG